MNKRISRLGVFLLLCYTALFVRLNIVQVFGAERLEEAPTNPRKIERTFDRSRGTIATADGAVVARTIETLGERFDHLREYPEGELYSQVVGHLSFQYGAVGVEATYNDELAGTTFTQQYRQLSDIFVERDTSAAVELTLRHDVQQVAREALGEQKGSVVALDPSTGEILAMWSYPSYDPNQFASHDPNVSSRAWESLNEDEDQPLLARAYRERFFPGSTFKVITAAAWLKTGVTLRSPVWPSATEYVPAGTQRGIGNFGGATCGGDLVELLRTSCNSAFAQIGSEEIGPEGLISTAESFGFNDSVPVDLPATVESVFPTDFGELLTGDGGPNSTYTDTPRLAQVSIGQNDVAATPLQMALVAAGVANEGRIMTPHVVSRITDVDGVVLEEIEPEQWRNPLTVDTADDLATAMVRVVEDGTGRNMAIPGVDVGGKTGTAQIGGSPPGSHAWVIGFARDDQRPGGQPDTQVAVAVIVEAQPGNDDQTGGSMAAPIAKAVIEAALAPQESLTGG